MFSNDPNTGLDSLISARRIVLLPFCSMCHEQLQRKHGKLVYLTHLQMMGRILICNLWQHPYRIGQVSLHELSPQSKSLQNRGWTVGLSPAESEMESARTPC